MRKLLVIIAVSLLAACGGTADESDSTSSGFNNGATSQISEIDIDIIYENENLRVHDTKIRSRIDDAYVHFTELFGGPPKKVNGEAYDRITVTIYDGFGGEADPETIAVGISDNVLYGFYNWEVSILHEVLHLWSAETFRYVNEGVTEYYTFRLAAELGMVSQSQILETFSKPIATYLGSKGIGKLSPRDAASTDELKRAHYFLVYHGGFVAGLVLDHQIRLKSEGKYSLDDVMVELYKTNSREKPYSYESLIETIRQSTSVDVSDFLQKHINGNEIIPVGTYFDFGMLVLMTKLEVEITSEEQLVLKEMLTFD